MTLRSLASSLALLATTALAGPALAQGTPTVLMDGSSTVYPISEAMAEEFQTEQQGKIRVTAGVSGTGGGFQKFCRGEIDIAAASRPISTKEIEACAAAGTEFMELPVAIDALATIVNPENDWAACMPIEELKKVWEPAAQGQISNWNQINPAYPDQAMPLFGAGTDSGTYDYYTLAIVGKEHSSRGDYTATEDDNITVQGVSGAKGGLGFLGLAYLTENEGKVKPVQIKQPDGSCVSPSIETAVNGTYQPLTRPLFYYVSVKSADKPHVKQFVEFLFDAGNQESLVSEVGYVALPADISTAALKKFEARKTGSHFGGQAKIGVTMADLVADTQ